jgi:predicted RNA-binding Zn ribbon-like protein
VNFAYYTDQPVQLAVALVNSYSPGSERDDLTDVAAVRELLDRHDMGDEPIVGELREDDLGKIRALRAALREVFAAPDEQAAAERLNELLRRSGAVPRISGHDSDSFHLHFEPLKAGVARWLGAVTAMGLTTVLCDHGFDRLGICDASGCTDAFVDETKNRRKRYCSEGCAHRTSVAAFRARRRFQPTETSQRR